MHRTENGPEKKKQKQGGLMDQQFDQSRTLTESRKRAVYTPNASRSWDSEVVKGLHYGQRKLLLSEIEFLSSCVLAGKMEKPPLIVYAGAANGSHLPFLFRLFPSVKFVLIDPAPFCKAVCEAANGEGGPVVELIQDVCTDELCLRLNRTYCSKFTLYLVSDIRSGVPSRCSNREHTSMMIRDNAWQRDWCYALEAASAMLKFHPPYPAVPVGSPRYDPEDDTPVSIRYFRGAALFGVWAPKSSSEVRLIVEGPFSESDRRPETDYDCRVFEEQCYFYNTHDRFTADVAAERLILTNYLRLTNQFESAEQMSKVISDELGYPLFLPLNSSEDRVRWVSLFYAARKIEQLPLYSIDSLSREALVGYLKVHSDGGAVDAIPSAFWSEIATPKPLDECYSIPLARSRQAPQFQRNKRPRQ